jgi:hypothetical protein
VADNRSGGCGCLGLVLALVVLGGIGNACSPDTPGTTASSSAASSVPRPAPTTTTTPAPVTKVVRTVHSLSDVTFTDGTRSEVEGPTTTGACDRRIQLPVARELLVGTTVQVRRTVTSLPPDLVLPDGQTYASAVSARTSDEVYDECYATSTTTRAPSTDVDVDVDHHGLPDGALTGGYCARKWWC